jgi:uncharacterized protein (DUF2126 family)
MRYKVTCNKRLLPLRSTGRKGEYVAGLRYRAWQPPSALHPTIAPHTPLVFDVIDSWNGRSVGGCTYFTAHPGGRSYDDFPVNAYAAETRRMSRFWDFGHTPGKYESTETLSKSPKPPGAKKPGRFESDAVAANLQEELSHDYPYTLDLRYQNR